MLVRHRGHSPAIDPSAYVAPGATVIGRVSVGPRARLMSGAVLDAEGSRVEVGECAIVAEHAVLRASAATATERPVLVGDHCFIGPHATLLGCQVDPAAYVAAGATILHGANVGSGAVVAVGALVHAATVLPDGFFVAPNLIAIGDPPTTYAPNDPALPDAIRELGFARHAFGVEAAWDDRIARYREATEVRSQEFAAHAEDEIIDP